MTTTPSLLLLSVVALLGLGTAESAKVKIAGGDVVLTDRLARTIQVKHGKIGGKYATINTVKLPSSIRIGSISQTTVLDNGLAFTTSLKGPAVTLKRSKNPTSYVVVSHLAIKGGAPKAFAVPNLGQGTLANCAVASIEKGSGKIGATKASGSVYEVWLLLDCSCPGGGVDSYKVLPFSYDNVAGTFQQNRGLEYETYTGGCTGSANGYLVTELGARAGNLTSIALPSSDSSVPMTSNLGFYFNGRRVVTASGKNTVSGDFTATSSFANGGYNQYFAVSIRGTTPSSTTPPQYTVVQYRDRKSPVLLGGIKSLSGGAFEPVLATRGGSAAYPLYFYNRTPKAANVVSIDKRKPGKAGKTVFTASRHIADIDVIP